MSSFSSNFHLFFKAPIGKSYKVMIANLLQKKGNSFLTIECQLANVLFNVRVAKQPGICFSS